MQENHTDVHGRLSLITLFVYSTLQFPPESPKLLGCFPGWVCFSGISTTTHSQAFGQGHTYTDDMCKPKAQRPRVSCHVSVAVEGYTLFTSSNNDKSTHELWIVNIFYVSSVPTLCNDLSLYEWTLSVLFRSHENMYIYHTLKRCMLTDSFSFAHNLCFQPPESLVTFVNL